MILIFDYFETILNTKSMDFNRGLYVFWESYYREKCPFEDMKKYGEDLFEVLLEKHRGGEEYPFVKNELPLFAKKFGGDKVTMSAEEEADFLMRCNDFVLDPEIERFLQKCSQLNIPMYVLESGHGDCGMVTLLFMTLCRYKGIPTRWQSGFMMHPSGWNLHDWAEVYFEGPGWVPVDESFGIPSYAVRRSPLMGT